MPKKEYMSFDEFVEFSGYKKNTVMRRCKNGEIPGIKKEGKNYIVLRETRYSFDIHRYKITDSAKKRYILLMAISEYKYISHFELKLDKKQFDAMLKELLKCELVRKNHLSNN